MKAQERGGVLQRPLNLRTLLHVVHPNHGSLLERLADRPLALLDRHLLRELPVGHAHLILHAERRPRGDQLTVVRHPALRKRALQQVAHVLQRHRVGLAQIGQDVDQGALHRELGAQTLVTARVEPVLVKRRRGELEHLPERGRLVVHEHLEHPQRHLRVFPRVAAKDGHGDGGVHLALDRARQPWVLQWPVAAHARGPLRSLQQEAPPG